MKQVVGKCFAKRDGRVSDSIIEHNVLYPKGKI